MNIHGSKSFGWFSYPLTTATFFWVLGQSSWTIANPKPNPDSLAQVVSEGIKNSFAIQAEKNNLLNTHSQQTVNYSGILPSLRFSAQQSFNKSQSQDLTTGTPITSESTSPSLALGATWTLWDNYQSIRNIQLGSKSIEQEKIRSHQQVQKYALDLLTSYLNYEELRSSRLTLEKHLQVSQETNEESQVLVKIGAKTKIDAMDTEIQVANDELALTDINKSILSAERNLKVLINSENIQRLPRIDILQNEPYFLKDAATKIRDLRTEWKNKIQEQNYDLRIQKLELEKSSMSLSQTKLNYFPTTQLSYSQSLDGNSLVQKDAINGQRPWLNSSSLSLTLSWQLWDWLATPANIDIASRNYQVAGLNYHQQFLQSHADLETLFDQIENLTKTIEIARMVLLKAEKQTEYSRESYRLGRITLLQMQASVNRLSSARNDLQSRLTDRAVNIANLYYRLGISITPPDVDFSWIQ